MRFSVVTPSFRQSAWLRLSISSVADQGVDAEHLVQDGGSDDGTLDWLLQDRRVLASSEPDSGMYDAINRGLLRASGDILSYLNCDEQYLPGALRNVAAFFESRPDVDVAFGDAIVVDAHGLYICSRPALIPTRYHSRVSGNLSILTCATFFRKRLLTGKTRLFDPSFRALGDADWICRLLDDRISMEPLRFPTSAFTETGSNLGLSPVAAEEQRRLARSAPWWARTFPGLIRTHYRLRKLLGGYYLCRPFSYALYTREQPDRRTSFHVDRPTARWKSRPVLGL